MLRVVHRLQFLNLDVVAGVLAGAVLAVSVTGARPPAGWWLVLAGTTWSIYVADRLLDVRSGVAASCRHRFALRHRVVLLAALSAVVPLCAGIALAQFPATVLVPGFALALGAAGYLLAAQMKGAVPKEPMAAAIYTCGIWLAPLALSPRVDPAALALVCAHACAAFGNLVQFGIFEIAEDTCSGSTSLARAIGAVRAGRVVRAATLAGFCALVAAVLAGAGQVSIGALALAPAVAMPWAMAERERFFTSYGRYRLAGDLVFVFLAVPALWIV